MTNSVASSATPLIGGSYQTDSETVTFNGITRNFASILAPDASTFVELVWAKPSGSMWVLLGSSTDFAHYAIAHNVTMNQTSGLFTSTPDSTSTSYLEMWTDSGMHNIYTAPATGVSGAAPVFTLVLSINMISGMLIANNIGQGYRESVFTAGADSQLVTDGTIVGTPTATATLTLIAPSTANKGSMLTIVTRAAYAISSASSNVLPLAGGSAGTTILAATAGKFAVLQSTGAAWQIINQN